MKREIKFTLNGKVESLTVEDAEILLEVLREKYNLWSVREGCGVGACGTCTVLLDGKPVSSCFLLASRVAGREVVTLEGLGRDGALHPIQEAFLQERALQCAYCTPGFILSVKALLAENPQPTDEEIREYLVGNLCRCAGYADILRAVKTAQKREGL